MAERSAKQLGLNKSQLPNSIVDVVSALNRSGFDAYIVGGGVRDSLLGLNPKDFDAVTDAKPHEVKDVFGKRCRIIGRRFQLAHVYSGRDLIEVATFRAPPKDDGNTTEEGMLIRDNVWGDIKQDFARRDFSINALYYQPIKNIVHDFCNALDDIESKTLRLLGHAPVRIEEDPVRLLRALRFKAKLDFDFDTELSEQFHDNNWALLEQVSPHRLYDETQKMFTGGYLVPLLPLLFEYGAIRHLIIYPPESASALVTQVAVNTDKRIASGKSINPAFFMPPYCGTTTYTSSTNSKNATCRLAKRSNKPPAKSLSVSASRPPFQSLQSNSSETSGFYSPNLPTLGSSKLPNWQSSPDSVPLSTSYCCENNATMSSTPYPSLPTAWAHGGNTSRPSQTKKNSKP